MLWGCPGHRKEEPKGSGPRGEGTASRAGEVGVTGCNVQVWGRAVTPAQAR